MRRVLGARAALRRLAVYRVAFAEEPKMRAYLGASLADDAGVAVSHWASMILLTSLFATQTARASLMIPTLGCFLAGTLIAGPLCDWERMPERLALWRWRLVVWGRTIETAALGSLVVVLALRPPSIGTVLPYMMISAFMKTALRPTRSAFLVDLLRREEVRLDESGRAMADEGGALLLYKTHLLTFSSLATALREAAGLVGLVLGGAIVGLAGGRYAALFAADVLTNVVFIALVFRMCHPTLRAREVRFRHLVAGDPRARGHGLLADAARHLVGSAREVFAFLATRAQRPLLMFLFGLWVFEVVTEFYDGKMIVKHVLGGSDESVRHAELVWTMATLGVVSVLPLLARLLGSLGRLFLATALIDGVVIAVAGQLAVTGRAPAIAPFVAFLALDRGLSSTSASLAELAQLSASSARIRGRVAGVFAVAAILGDIGAEGAATWASERFGIAPMVRGLGIAQVLIFSSMALAGGRALWRFGIVSDGSARGLSSPVVLMPSAQQAGGV
jgi:hypothetical protein